jgi:hypothetical protein
VADISNSDVEGYRPVVPMAAMVDPNYAVVVSIDKRFLPPGRNPK